MSDYKIPEEILLEVLAFESFVKADLRRVEAYEAEGRMEEAEAQRLLRRAAEAERSGERFMGILRECAGEPGWSGSFPARDGACAIATKG